MTRDFQVFRNSDLEAQSGERYRDGRNNNLYGRTSSAVRQEDKRRRAG